ncbi:MAG: hypothetical protein BLM47_01680 [Candidatus Reconcilbacillus cellulovorans]|uniref:3D domain-containing protein n=1 Tax=Candidatus Reconcilbacillus cellulovorans TaxID=1906605 RepID=A0A2A6E3B2_9BACL|nr:MAG: hypothetical protein BLM47_01680 [Candidatus Reconcilbacillus cellulovorans]
MFLRVCAWWLAIWFAFSAWAAPPAVLAPGDGREPEAGVPQAASGINRAASAAAGAPVPAATPAPASPTKARAPVSTPAPAAAASNVAPVSASAAASMALSAADWMERNKRAPSFHSPDQLRQCRRVVVTATGYYAGPESTGKRPGDPGYGITFSGVRARRDVYSTIAADPALFPIGTELYVPGYGYAVVADTGSSVKGHVIDLYFERKDQIYREWGKRRVEVLVLRLGDGKLTEEKMNRYNDLGGRREVASPGCF